MRRVDGRDFARYARGIPQRHAHCYVGMPAAEYRAYASAGASPSRTLAKGGQLVGKRRTAEPQRGDGGVPGANGRGPAEQWLRLFQMLAAHGVAPDGTTRLLQPSTVRRLSTRHRVGMHDEVQGIRCDWSLGLAVGSALCGEHASAGTFGHGGSQSSLGLVDPLHGLSVVIVCNARPGPRPHHERMRRLTTLLYEDLGLVPRTRGRRPPQPPPPSSCPPPPIRHSPVVTRRALPKSQPPSPVVTRRRLPSRSACDFQAERLSSACTRLPSRMRRARGGGGCTRTRDHYIKLYDSVNLNCFAVDL